MNDVPGPASMGGPLSEADLAAFAEFAPERIDCELWTLLDWTFWAAGMGDTFREPLASTMVAAVPEGARDQAELLMQEWLRIRDVESPSKTNAGLRAKLAEAERLAEIQARLDAATPGPWKAEEYDDEPGEAGCGILVGKGLRQYAIAASIAYPWHDQEQTERDAALIANAPRDINYLLSRVGVLEGQLATARGLHKPERRYTPDDGETSYATYAEAADASFDGTGTPRSVTFFEVCSHCASIEMAEGCDHQYKESLWPCEDAVALGLDGGGSDER